MIEKNILVTGSSGLIGGEVVDFFCKEGYKVLGIDNNMREKFFGPKGSTKSNLERLRSSNKNFVNYSIDIRDRKKIQDLFRDLHFELIVHTAAQPSHDKAADIPFLDFEVNALGTLNLLECVRNNCKESPFIHLSTNKVYGDNPNNLELNEMETRWEYKGKFFKNGIDEKFSIDHTTHSLFGVSKASSDLLVQEYGRYFNMPTCCLRGGCLTGPSHSGVELHGFLNYLIRCNITKSHYKIFGYKGKQVRDNIHSEDVAKFIYEFYKRPKIGAVYNIGGGYKNSISIIEAFKKIELISGKKMQFSYEEKPRIGDHICYYSDLNKIQTDFPNWKITKSLDDIFQDLYINTIY
tara:strand:- start:1304 stop:2353 length:1050 start_codon:yes stop_codon:yes gene_type:complete